MTIQQTLGKGSPMSERVTILLTKAEKEKLNDACFFLGKKLKSKVSMGELIRYATFTIYLPDALKKIKA